MKDSKLGLLFLSFPKLSEKSVKLGNKKKCLRKNWMTFWGQV